MSKINMMLLTWNRLEYLQRSLPCYLDKNGSIPHTLVITNNGSTDGTLEYLQSMESSIKSSHPSINLKVRHYSKNYGYPRVTNHFYRLSDPDAEYVGGLCDDVITTDGCVDLLSKSLDAFPEIGIVGLNDGRDWCEKQSRNGVEIYFGDGFFWNDDCYMMRKDVINEVAKIGRWTYDRLVYSGYILMNIWGLSTGRYYSDIKSTKYQLAVTAKCIKNNISNESSASKMAKHNLLVRRLFIQNTPKYWETTGGVLQWVENGNQFSFPEEPKDEIRCDNFPDDAATPLAQLDKNANGQSYTSLFSPEELKFWERSDDKELR